VKLRSHVRVMGIMKRLILFVAIAACGGKQPPPSKGSGDPPGPVADTRTEIEKRRDTACETLRPKIVQCAVDDAKADLDAGKTTKEQFEKDTANEVRSKLGSEWMKACRVDMSSRQVRVLEVCHQEETQCGPLVSCLEHLNDKPK